MKRLLLALVSILIVPNTASALERLSDSELEAITAQAGIILHAFNDVRFHPDLGEIEIWYPKDPVPMGFSIASGLSNSEFVALYALSGNALEFNDIEYYDTNGGAEIWYRAETASMGFVFAEGSDITLRINSVGFNPDSTRPGFLFSHGTDLQCPYPDIFDYSNAVDPETGEPVFEFRPMTIQTRSDLPILAEMIDTGRAAVIPGVARTAKLSGIAMGIPTVETHMAPGSYYAFDVLVTTADHPLERVGRVENPAERDTWSFGTIYLREGTTTNIDGRIEIVALERYLDARGAL